MVNHLPKMYRYLRGLVGVPLGQMQGDGLDLLCQPPLPVVVVGLRAWQERNSRWYFAAIERILWTVTQAVEGP